MSRSGTVALLGRPNAGKSTLINLLLHNKVAIVSDKPQTTRHRIAGVLTEPRGQIVLFDLPGVHRPLHRMNVQMMHVLRDTLAEVDVVLHLFDVTQPVGGGGDRFVLDLVHKIEVPVVLVATKVDIEAVRDAIEERIGHFRGRHDYAAAVLTSAVTGEGCQELIDLIFPLLPEQELLIDPGLSTTQSERFFIAELIREAVLGEVEEELPFMTAVDMRHMEEEETPQGPLLRLWADIVVERESQKGIIVGRGGRTVRQIGTTARAQIERLLGARVYLDLLVKARPGWREDARFLADLQPIEAPFDAGTGGSTDE